MLVTEVAEEGRSAHLGALSYVRDAHGVEAALSEQVQCRPADRFFGTATFAVGEGVGLSMIPGHQPSLGEGLTSETYRYSILNETQYQRKAGVSDADS